MDCYSGNNMIEKTKQIWTYIAEQDIKRYNTIYDLSMYISSRTSKCADKWKEEKLYHIELLIKELKKRLKKGE